MLNKFIADTWHDSISVNSVQKVTKANKFDHKSQVIFHLRFDTLKSGYYDGYMHTKKHTIGSDKNGVNA